MKDLFKRRARRKKIVAWVLGAILLGLSVGAYVVLIDTSITSIFYIILVFFSTWGVRSIYQENKDTMMADMDEIELGAMKATIERVLKERGMPGEKKQKY